MAELLRCAVAAAWLLAVAPVHAALPGDPPFSRLVPDLEIYPQNFAIAQDRQGIIYVASYEGVLTFDGARWELVRLPKKELVRALAYDGAGRVYVGSYDAFGYLQRDETGREIYHDLTAAFADLLKGEQFGDIWDLQLAPEGVFFRALHHVFLYEPATGAVRLWRHQGRFGAITRTADAVVLQFRGEGLRRYEKGEWLLLPGSEPVKDIVYRFVELPDGGLLLLEAEGSWRVYRNGRLEKFAVPKSFPASGSCTDGLVLGDGTLALVTDNGLMLLLDPRTGANHQFRLDPGYLNQMIFAADGGLLVVGDDAVLHIEWPARWTVLGPSHGLSSSLHGMARWGERWYALTGAGVRAVISDGGSPPEFRRLAWTEAEAWDLLPLDDRSALLAESYAVKLIEGASVRTLTHSALYPRVLHRSRFDPDVVFVGAEPGFAVLRRSGGSWKLKLEAQGLGELRVLDILEVAPQRLWLGSERGGVWRLHLSADYSKVVEARQIGPEDGIQYGQIPGGHVTAFPDGTIIASTEAGLFRWTGERFEKVDLDGLDTLRGEEEWLHLVVSPGGERWAYSYNRLYRYISGKGWRREELGGIRRGAIDALTFDENGAVVVSSSYAVLQQQPGRAGANGLPPQVVLRAVERAESSGARTTLPLRPNAPLELPHSDLTLTFRFALPDYLRPEAVRYSTRLTGIEEQFSEWFGTPRLSVSQLLPGRYTFELQARDSEGRITTIEPLHISVIPRWYESAWAWPLWILLGGATVVLLSLGIVRWRTEVLIVETRRLEGMVADRTAELEVLNHRLDAMAHHDSLTGVSNRRDLDKYLEEVWLRCARSDQKVSVLAIDVDNFKTFNDRNGHQAGDEVLIGMVQTVSACLDRSDEMLARYGGDEFFAVLPDVDEPAARELAETMRRKVEERALGTTISIGVASRRPHAGGQVRELVRAADAALYAAKAAGRNRVATATG